MLSIGNASAKRPPIRGRVIGSEGADPISVWSLNRSTRKQSCQKSSNNSLTTRLVPVIALEEVAHADPLASALVAGGLPVAEVTFRTAAAADSIRVMAERGDLIVGAGTVLTPAQVDQAREAGATFIVSPGFNPKVVRYCLDQGLPIVPGISTPRPTSRWHSTMDWRS